jgi:hypothetical protein
MNHISLTIPADDPRALVAGAVMLLTAAGKLPEIDLDDLSGKTCTGSGSCGGHHHGPEVAAAPTPLPPAHSTAAADQSQTAPVVDSSATPPAVSAPVPPAGQPASAPTAPAAPSNPAAGVELDTDALPWDARIHSSSHARNADGRWKRKRNINETLIARVEAELHAVMALPSPGPVVSVIDGRSVITEVSPDPANRRQVGDVVGHIEGVAPVRPPLGGTWPTAPAPLNPAGAAAPVWPFPNPGETPAPPPPPPAATVSDFPSFLKSVSGLVQAQRITMPRVNDILAAAGVPNLSALGTRPDLIPAIWMQIDSETGGAL